MNLRSVDEFEGQRSRLFGIAYRMLGSAEEAEDVVQDAFLRWDGAERDAIVAPSSWLAKVVTNLSINRLTSARARREQYIGPWLPEPVLTSDGALWPDDEAEQRDSVSLALLTLLERLTPTERAVFVLREAFAYSHRELAEILELSEANCRQLHHRATRRLGESPPRFRPDTDQWHRLVERFLTAARDGDMSALEDVLTADAVAVGDGGGKATAGTRPVLGRTRVARLLVGLLRKYATTQMELTFAEVNGQAAILAWHRATLAGVMVLEIADGAVRATRTVTNPEKLGYLAMQLSHSEVPSGS
ncbi:MAG: RNA polymerase sigma-70 factor [Streptosporangiales bacterium]|nr:RNA polymerase sigma-70 factor [Streptosporangiales bacterium]